MLICTSHDCRAPAAACGGGLEPDSISDNYGGSPCACSIHAIGQRLCAVDAAAQSRNLRTRRAGGQYTQPLLTLAYIFGYSPPAKSGFGKPTSSASPGPGSRPGGQGRGLSAQAPGVLIGPVRPRRSGMAHAASFSRGGPTAVSVNRLKTVFVPYRWPLPSRLAADRSSGCG